MDNVDEMLNKIGRGTQDYMTRDEWLTKQINEQITAIRDTDDISDGSHTFGELYHHRAVLFATICNSNRDISWKSKRHMEGDMIQGFFIVGIETVEGQFTYHYPLEYWSLFKVKKLNYAPEWDGHSSDDVMRLLSLVNEGNN